MADENPNVTAPTESTAGSETPLSITPVSIPVKHDDDGEFVSKKKFDTFQQETSTALNAILGILEKKPEAEFRAPAPGSVAESVADAQALVEAASADRSNGYMPPQYQRLFEKYFDVADGFEARLSFPEIDEKGRETGGITFTIVVPMKFSNAQDAYKTFYKSDLRTRALRADNISKGIDDWCQRVARNLKYDKHIKTK